MQVRSIAGAVALILIVGLLSACGAKGRTVVTTDEGQVVPGKTVSLRIKGGQGTERRDFVEVSRRFHAALSNRLLAEGIFVAVVDPGEPADYEMVATIESLARRGTASGGQRLGVIHVSIRLVDKAIDKEIKSFLAIGAGPRVIGGAYGIGPERDLTEAIEQALIQITQALGGTAPPDS